MASAPRAICRHDAGTWQVALFCLSLCVAVAGCGGPAAIPPTPQDTLRAKLRQPVSVAADHERLKDVLERLGREQEIDIAFNVTALEAESLSVDDDVTLQLRDIPLA